ncbi:MAG TPA: rod shape-determining protein MreC [Novosphingobium sp.]|nr:rod shape-determining protein MreC [Novosphingobium sp.]
MAPPGNRRSGFSRRAQYSTFAGYLIAVAGVIVAGLLVLVSTHDSTVFAGARTAATDATAPVARVAAEGRTDSQSLWNILAGYFTSGSENAQLKREVALARVRLAESAAVAEENRRLKALAGLMDGNPKPVVATRLIGSSSSSTRRFATLGAGSRQGVSVGMPVRSPLGLVGRVLEVGGSTARVLLITDPESVVPVRRASDGVPAFAQGRADGTIQLRLNSLGINPLRRGDAIVTSGSGGLYPPGIAIAVVTRLLPDGAIARPLSDPGATEFVVVEREWNPVGVAPARAVTP